MRVYQRSIVFACIAGLVAAVPTPAAEIAWHSADGAARQLTLPVSIAWANIPLRQAIGNLAKAQRVAIVLDRRVDPDQNVELSLSDVPLETALLMLAGEKKLGLSRVGPVVYLGPPAVAAKLRSLVELHRQELETLPAERRMALAAPKAVKWEMLATPKELIHQAGEAYGVQVAGLERIPHDLWAAGELPAVGFIERLSLLAVQFDLTFEFDAAGRTVRLVPIPDEVLIEREHRTTNAAEVAARLKQSLPEITVSVREGRLAVRATAEDQQAVADLLAGKSVRRTTAQPGKKVYQLTVSLPVGRLIDELANRMNLAVELDRAAIEQQGLSLDREVKVSVKNVSEDELWKAVLEPAGLTFQRRGEKLRITPNTTAK